MQFKDSTRTTLATTVKFLTPEIAGFTPLGESAVIEELTARCCRNRVKVS